MTSDEEKRKPFGIWVVTVLAALFALSQFKNIIEVLLVPDGFATTGSVMKFVFSVVAFPLASTWSVLTFKVRQRAVFVGAMFFAWSLLPFLFVFADMALSRADIGMILTFLPVVLLWCVLVLSLVLWTKRLVRP